jgi:hypothetical protein
MTVERLRMYIAMGFKTHRAMVIAEKLKTYK